MKRMILCLVLCSLCFVDLAKAEEDPCEPNPCGENGICIARSPTIISCSCKDGYHQTSDGCLRDVETFLAELDPNDYFQDDDIDEERPNRPTTSTTTTTTTRPPRFQSKSDRPKVGSNIFGPRETDNLVAARDPSAEINIGRATERTTTTTTTTTPSPPTTSIKWFNPRFDHNPFARDPSLVPESGDFDPNLVYPEECLINEDCLRTHFCDQTVYRCVLTCGQPRVCGVHAHCKPSRHRPVCACEEGYMGNAYEGCVKRPSRVGMRFRRAISPTYE